MSLTTIFIAGKQIATISNTQVATISYHRGSKDLVKVSTFDKDPYSKFIRRPLMEEKTPQLLTRLSNAIRTVYGHH